MTLLLMVPLVMLDWEDALPVGSRSTPEPLELVLAAELLIVLPEIFRLLIVPESCRTVTPWYKESVRTLPVMVSVPLMLLEPVAGRLKPMFESWALPRVPELLMVPLTKLKLTTPVPLIP